MKVELLDGNQCAAWGARLAKVDYVPFYPITPQTEIGEVIAQWKADGEFKGEFEQLDSEHSVMSAALGSAATGARTFTASSSQGLLLMHEILPNVSGTRLPMVFVNVSRSISAPISLWCFTKEAKVLMADFTYKNINEIKKGDYVLGIDRKPGKGYFVKTKVKTVYERKSDELVKIKSNKSEIICTKNHRFYHHPSHNRWIQAKNLKNRELKYFGYNFKENEDYMRGYLAAVADGDGCFSYTYNKNKDKKYLRYEVHARDKEMIDYTVKYAKKLGFKIRFHDYRKKLNDFGAIINSNPEAKRFKKAIYGYQSKDYCRGYLAGIYDAEGTGPYEKARQITIYNSNKNIVRKILSCLDKLKITAKRYDGNRTNNIVVSNVPKFFLYCQPKIQRKRRQIYNSTIKSVKDKIKIDNVQKYKHKKTVYNIETGTNNYIVNGFLVHNCDHNDALAMRDAGWIMVICETNQEVLDSVIMGYRVSENILLPTFVNMDGFVHSFTREAVELPEESVVDLFIPKQELKHKLDINHPKSLAIPTLHGYMEFRSQVHKAMLDSIKVIEKTHKEWKSLTGRGWDFFDEYKLKDAEDVIVMIGANTTIAKSAVDKMRKNGKKVGILRIRVLRPFNEELFREKLNHVKRIGVVDQNIAPGLSGILFPEVRSALFGMKVKVSNYITALGGKPVHDKDFMAIFEEISKGKEVRKWLM